MEEEFAVSRRHSRKKRWAFFMTIRLQDVMDLTGLSEPEWSLYTTGHFDSWCVQLRSSGDGLEPAASRHAVFAMLFVKFAWDQRGKLRNDSSNRSSRCGISASTPVLK